MKVTPGKIHGTWFIEPNVFEDSRGNFHEVFKLSEIEKFTGRTFPVAQVNQSKSAAGVVRGIHWTDSTVGQAKFVSCPQGEVWDVVVDLREDSPTYGQWDAVVLSEQNNKCILISEGLGHAFLALKDDSVVNYLCTSEYEPASDRTVNPLSPSLAIPFEAIADERGISGLVLSEKDRQAKSF